MTTTPTATPPRSRLLDRIILNTTTRNQVASTWDAAAARLDDAAARSAAWTPDRFTTEPELARNAAATAHFQRRAAEARAHAGHVRDRRHCCCFPESAATS